MRRDVVGTKIDEDTEQQASKTRRLNRYGLRGGRAHNLTRTRPGRTLCWWIFSVIFISVWCICG
jgi:hypothetical protein